MSKSKAEATAQHMMSLGKKSREAESKVIKINHDPPYVKKSPHELQVATSVYVTQKVPESEDTSVSMSRIKRKHDYNIDRAANMANTVAL